MLTVRDVGEFGLIDRIARILPKSPIVVDGVGDDCAVLRIGERLLLASCDQSIENVHFCRANITPDDIGWKAAASSISDIAAMGGTPLFGLVALSCPSDTGVSYIEAVYQGLANVFSQYGAVIVGGDTVESNGPLTLDVTVVGEVRGARCLRRRGALAGDVLAVTGHLGLAAAGLYALEHGKDIQELTQRQHRPRPRVREGQWLSARPEVHSMIDISDGLLQDVGHLAEASELGIDIDPGALPVAEALAKYCQQEDINPVELIMKGGEDYELAFSMDCSRCAETMAAIGNEFRTLITVVGRFSDEWTGVRVSGAEFDKAGFQHFR
jgi:thiamine-monophosphate kinase